MRYKVFNKLMAVVLACSVIAAMLAGCGEKSNPTSDESSSSAGKSSEASTDSKGTEDPTEPEAFDPRSITEGVTLTIATKEHSRIVDWNTLEETLMIEEALGVNLEFVSYPSADYASKLNTMIMSGEEMPDILFQPGSGYTGWIEEGALLPLTEYYGNPDYAKNLNAASERTETDIAQYMMLPDGNIYAVPNWSHDPGAEVNQKLWVYQPWLDQLGVKMPETTEEFYELCQKVAATDLNGNGKNDEVCLTYNGSIGAWFDFLMTPYVYAHDSLFRVVEDGKVSFAYTTEEWKEGLKYIRKFFEEGLIPMETLTQSTDQYRALLYAETPTVLSFTGWCYSGSDIYRRADYNYIVALEGPTGRKVSHYQPSLPGVGAVITADCDNPDAAFLVLDYMCSEEISLMTRYGKQGENWDYWENVQMENKEDYGATFEGYDISILAEYPKIFWADTNPQTVCYMEIGPMVRDKYSNIARAINRNPATEEERIRTLAEDITSESIMEAENYRPEAVFDYGPLSTEEIEATADIAATLKSYVDESINAFLSGDKDIDAEWDAYIAELEKIGYKTMLDVYQIAYDRVH